MYSLFTTADCSYCKMAEAVLEQNDLPYEKHVLTMDEAKARGWATVPQIYHRAAENGSFQHIGGYTDLLDHLGL